MSNLSLRWVENNDATRAAEVPIELVDSLTIIVGVSRVIEERWQDLSDTDRTELARMLRRRAERLLVDLSEHEFVRL